MARGERVRRGVVALSLVVAGAAGCSAGGGPSEQVARAAPPASRSAVAGRRVVRFRVDSLASSPKQSLPGEEVYGATTAPVLRLITCAGTFDRAQRSYRENLVVSATRVGDGGTEAGR
jgi:hypothetical protein